MRVLNFAFLFGILAVGCASTPSGPKFFVEVSGLAVSGSNTGRTYVIAPGVDDLGAEDLQFREFASYVRGAMSRKGFVEVQDTTAADIALFLTYGIGDPERRTYVRNVPVYGQIGGGTSTVTLSSFGAGGWSTTTGTVTSPGLYGQVGTQTQTETSVSHFRYLLLDAWDLAEFRKTKKARPVWKMIVTSSGSSGDLREVFPILVAAGEPHLGTDTGKQLHVSLSESDPRVAAVLSVK
jgi:hypothetical protein